MFLDTAILSDGGVVTIMIVILASIAGAYIATRYFLKQERKAVTREIDIGFDNLKRQLKEGCPK